MSDEIAAKPEPACTCDRELLLARCNIRLAEFIEREAHAKYAEAQSLMTDATALYREATAVAARALFDLTQTSAPN